MTSYVDSSVALRHILLGEATIRHALAAERVVSSELMEIECRRTIHRCRMQGDLDDQETATAVARLEALLRGISLIGLSAEIKKRAMEAYPVRVKTLDALHIASALRFADRFPDEQVLIFSHDSAFNRCARALGFIVPLWDSEEHQQEAEI